MHSHVVDLPTMRRLVYNALRNGDWKRQYFYRPTDERMAQVATHEWLHAKDFNRLMNRPSSWRTLDGAFDGMPLSCLIVEGRWDPTWGEEKPKRFAAHLPTARLVVLDRASHFSFAEEPDRFFAELRRFVADLTPPDAEALARWRLTLAPYQQESERDRREAD